MVDATMEQNLKLLFKTYLLLTKCLIINKIKEIISNIRTCTHPIQAECATSYNLILNYNK